MSQRIKMSQQLVHPEANIRRWAQRRHHKRRFVQSSSSSQQRVIRPKRSLNRRQRQQAKSPRRLRRDRRRSKLLQRHCLAEKIVPSMKISEVRGVLRSLPRLRLNRTGDNAVKKFAKNVFKFVLHACIQLLSYTACIMHATIDAYSSPSIHTGN